MEPVDVMGHRRIASIALLAVLGVVAGLAFHRVFGLGEVLPAVVAPAAGASIVAVLCGVRRMSGTLTALASLVSYVVVVMVVVLWDTTATGLPTGDTFDAFTSGLVDGWRGILVSPVPPPDDPALLVPVATVVWLTTALACELVKRTRAVVGVLALPLLSLFTAYLFGSGGSGPGPLIPAAFIVAGAGFVLVRRRDLDHDVESAGAGQRSDEAVGIGISRGAVAIGAVVVVVVAVFASALVSVVSPDSEGEPYELRDRVEAPIGEEGAVSPLAQVRLWNGELAEEVLFTVEAPEGADEWRLAVLDEYDGVDWTTSGTYEEVGPRLPPTDVGFPVDERTQEITIEGLEGPWLPVDGVGGRPVAVELQGEPGERFVEYDDVRGVLATSPAPDPGLAYELEAARPRIPAEDYLGASATADPALVPYIELPPGLDPKVNELMANIQARAATPFEQVSLIEDYFHTDGYEVDPETFAGHNYSRIGFLVGDEPGHRGTSDQYAGAFAVMARRLGLPSRVVVGFRAPDPGATGTVEITGADAYAWPEVYFEDVGWVRFDPTPTSENTGDQAAEEEEEPAESELEEAKQQGVADAGNNDEVTPRESPEPMAEPESRTERTVRVTVIVAGVVLLLLVLAALTVVVVRHRRRAARQRGSVPQRIVGAYRESLDHLRDVGVEGLDAMTATEVTAAGAAAVGGAPDGLDDLGELANRALFDGTDLTDDDADRAWQDEQTFAARIRTTMTRRRRLQRRVDPRTLVSR